MHSLISRLALLAVASLGLQACKDPAGSGDAAVSGGGAGVAGASAGAGGLAGTAPPSSAGAGAGAAGTQAPPVTPEAAGAGAGAGGGGRSAAGTGGAAGSAGAGSGGAAGAAGEAGDAGTLDAGGDVDPLAFASGLHELFIHDACTGEYAPQPDTCLHEQEVGEEITFGGAPGTTYAVTLRVRGLFEPTTIDGGQTPMAEHPYFKVGGTVAALDYSHWHIEVGSPAQTYWLNHYPSTSHTIYQEDFEATIEIDGGATVAVRVIDGNDREIDNAENGPADRRQLIEGVTDEVLDGQVLRLDVIAVEAL